MDKTAHPAQSLKEIIDNRKQKGIITVYSTDSKQLASQSSGVRRLTPADARSIVDSLDPRVYRDQRFRPFYCKAVLRLGYAKVTFLQSMALDPSVRNPERMFSWLLKQELEGVA